MLVDIIHKLVETKAWTPFLLLTALFNKQIKNEEEGYVNYEEAPGDNFPQAVMSR